MSPDLYRRESRAVARTLVRTGLRVVLTVAIGVAAAAGLAVARGGELGGQFRASLWIVGCLMVGMTIFSGSPSTRRAPDEVGNALLGRRFLGTDDRGGASVAVVLALSAVGVFGIALLLS
jgi:hypothetical protein